MTKPIILLDMDAVLFDFHNGLRDLVIEDAYINGYETQIPGEFETWSLFTEHEETDRAISNVLNSQRFFAELEPMPGAIEAVHTLRETATVFFCSTPFHTNPHCAEDKAYSLNKAFGLGSSQSLILTSDKTVVMGDVLVDDRPGISGALYPAWTQIYFTHLYNKNEQGARIDNWNGLNVDFVEAVAWMESQRRGFYHDKRLVKEVADA